MQNVLDELYSGNSLVALVGKGYFSDNGHFLILIKPGADENTVRIADSANLENCYHDWPISFILEQLKSNSSGGKLLWSINLPLECGFQPSGVPERDFLKTVFETAS